jgi:hypothetical protein
MAGCGAARVFARNGGLPSVRLRPHSLTLHHEDLRGLGGSGFCNVMNYYNRYPNSRLEANAPNARQGLLHNGYQNNACYSPQA